MTGSATVPLVRCEIADGVATLTLNRPDVLNSFNLDMAIEMRELLAGVSVDPEVRAVLLTGEGRAFCAGQDLASVPLDPAASFDLAETVRVQYNPIIRAIRGMEKPVVCAVNGVAAGAGASLAFACDLVLASTEASFIQSFCRIGLIPDSGGTYFLPRLAGTARAAGLALLGDKLGAEQACAWGLIWAVHEPASLMPRARELAGRLATQPTRGLGLVKRALAASLENGLDAQLDLEAVLQGEAGRTADFREGVEAFRQKRVPHFRGE
jgi:2-(1,2-epoxy-1,2-dihydrophenyl)acetyl-CoA isomerase